MNAIAQLDNDATARRVMVRVVARAAVPRFWECRHAITHETLVVFDGRLALVDGRPWPHSWFGDGSREASKEAKA